MRGEDTGQSGRERRALEKPGIFARFVFPEAPHHHGDYQKNCLDLRDLGRAFSLVNYTFFVGAIIINE